MNGNMALTNIGKSIVQSMKAWIGSSDDELVANSIDDIPDFNSFLESNEDDAMKLKKVEAAIKKARMNRTNKVDDVRPKSSEKVISRKDVEKEERYR